MTTITYLGITPLSPGPRQEYTLGNLHIVGRSAMDLIADRGRRVAIEELNTTRLLAHARKQA